MIAKCGDFFELVLQNTNKTLDFLHIFDIIHIALVSFSPSATLFTLLF